MPLMNRYRFVWSGWSGGDGYSTFYGNGSVAPNTFVTALQSFMAGAIFATSAGQALPATIGIQGDAFVTQVEDTNGEEQGVTGITAPVRLAGTSTTLYAAPSGASITWITPAFIKGRRLRGRTYLVPLAGAAYQNDGTLATTYKAQLEASAQTLITSGAQLVVWHRPTTKGGVDGTSVLVSAAKVKDHSSILRSRRGAG